MVYYNIIYLNDGGDGLYKTIVLLFALYKSPHNDKHTLSHKYMYSYI